MGKYRVKMLIFLKDRFLLEKLKKLLGVLILKKPLYQMGSMLIFFNVCCPIIGNEVCEAILDFFQYGMLLNQLKAIFIMLVPKVKNAATPNKFRPISLTNQI